ncbi:putative Glycine zipper family protein [Azospirillaceae bacterium]
MRFILVLLAMLLLPLSTGHAQAISVADSPNTQATNPANAANSQTLDGFRTVVRGALQQSREAVVTTLAQAQKATGMTNDQIWAIGVGVVAGAILADLVGTGGMGTLLVATGGGYLGNWFSNK